MQGLNDLIPKISSYLDRPDVARSISYDWIDVLNMRSQDAIDRLQSIYPGLRRDMKGRQYSTLYTSMRDAIRNRDVDDIRIIANEGGYLPIPWDLLVWDIVAYHRDPMLLQHRWTRYAKVLYRILTEGFNLDKDYSLRDLKPFLHIDELGDTFSLQPDIYSLQLNMQAPGIYQDIYGFTSIDDEEDEENYPAVYMNMEIDIPYTDKILSRAMFYRRGSTLSLTWIPTLPLSLNVYDIAILDRPDLLDLLLRDGNRTQHILTKMRSYKPFGRYINLYLSQTGIDINGE